MLMTLFIIWFILQLYIRTLSNTKYLWTCMSLKLGKNRLIRLINKELLTLIEEPRGSDTAKLECAKKRRTVYPS